MILKHMSFVVGAAPTATLRHFGSSPLVLGLWLAVVSPRPALISVVLPLLVAMQVVFVVESSSFPCLRWRFVAAWPAPSTVVVFSALVVATVSNVPHCRAELGRARSCVQAGG